MARDHKGGGVTTERKDGKSRMDMLDWRAEAFSRPVLSTLDGRELSPTTRTLRPRLNPAFAAWLMGLPGWWTSPAVTSSARSAMEPYRSALRSQLQLLLGERSSADSEVCSSQERPSRRKDVTDRVNYLTVVVKGNLREDDAMPLMAAIGLLKGVVSVGFSVADPEAYAAEARARENLSQRILDVVYPPRSPA
jgi:hypothetical protein